MDTACMVASTAAAMEALAILAWATAAAMV